MNSVAENCYTSYSLKKLPVELQITENPAYCPDKV